MGYAVRRLIGAFALIALAGGFAAYVTGTTALAQDKDVVKSAWDGVYTDEQALRGEESYHKNCDACHQPDLTGSTQAPALAGDGVRQAWERQTVYELWNTVRTTMPQDNPAGLDSQSYVDIVAFLLKQNMFPAGTHELSKDAEALKQIRMSKEKN